MRRGTHFVNRAAFQGGKEPGNKRKTANYGRRTTAQETLKICHYFPLFPHVLVSSGSSCPWSGADRGRTLEAMTRDFGAGGAT